ncbi:WD40-repeat-containing domain protein [Gorgonomyces haynaldii]|nr:WD40-repeat-containing domain protein [Gorgonomyces haynaldii]
MSVVPVHRCRFFKYSSSTIVHMAWSGKELAVARGNGNIELWTFRKTWYHSRTISGNPDEPIEALVWIRNRLFSAGLSGVVLEYDMVHLKPKSTTHSMGGPIWCMKPNQQNTRIAIGCEDGHVRLFDVEDFGLTYSGALEKQKERVISLAWHPDGLIVCGSVHGTIRTVDLTTGRTVQRMNVDSTKEKDTIVWELACLPNGTIVAGDALGHVSFWDPHVGILKKMVKAHMADVLCIAVAKNGRVFTSGVDRRMVQLEHVDNKQKWVMTGQKRYHTHDVRSLIYIEERPYDCLVSGGVDMSLIISSPVNDFKNMKQQRMPTYPQKSIISVASELRLALGTFDDHLQLFALGALTDPTTTVNDRDRLEHMHQRQILQLKVKGNTNLLCSAISADGTWIACSNRDELRLYHLLYDESMRPTVDRVRDLPGLPSAFVLKFTNDSSRLIVGGSDGVIYVVGLEDEIAVLSAFDFHTKGPEGKPKQGTILTLAVSSDDYWLVSGDHKNRIAVHSLLKSKFKTVLPTFHSLHTSIQFHPSKPWIVITLQANEFFVFDVESNHLLPWSQKNSHNLPLKFTDKTDPILGVCFDDVRQDAFIIYGSGYTCTVDMRKPMPPRDAKLNQIKGSHALELNDRFQSIMALVQMGSELVVAERPVLHVLAELPPAFSKHKYGQ